MVALSIATTALGGVLVCASISNSTLSSVDSTNVTDTIVARKSNASTASYSSLETLWAAIERAAGFPALEQCLEDLPPDQPLILPEGVYNVTDQDDVVRQIPRAMTQLAYLKKFVGDIDPGDATEMESRLEAVRRESALFPARLVNGSWVMNKIYGHELMMVAFCGDSCAAFTLLFRAGPLMWGGRDDP